MLEFCRWRCKPNLQNYWTKKCIVVLQGLARVIAEFHIPAGNPFSHSQPGSPSGPPDRQQQEEYPPVLSKQGCNQLTCPRLLGGLQREQAALHTCLIELGLDVGPGTNALFVHANLKTKLAGFEFLTSYATDHRKRRPSDCLTPLSVCPSPPGCLLLPDTPHGMEVLAMASIPLHLLQ